MWQGFARRFGAWGAAVNTENQPPDTERQRLAELEAYGVLDTDPEPAFDDVVKLVADICDVPIAVVNFVGEQRQFFKAELGLGVRATPLEHSFCAHAIREGDFMVVPD